MSAHHTNEPTELTPGALDRMRRARAWLFDMDGVLYVGTRTLPGVQELLDTIAARGGVFNLATNNSMSTAAQYVEKLSGMGITAPEDSILTSAMATRDYLLKTLPAGAGVHVVGMPALSAQLFRDVPFHPVTDPGARPDAVVVGLDKAFTYDKLAVATAFIRGGATFIATNADATLPTEAGIVPGCGSLIAALRTASGVNPVIIGKPEPLMMEMALARLGIDPDAAIMIGDRLDTDILSGHRAGLLTALVLTGISQRGDIPTAEVGPDLVFPDLPALTSALVAG